MFLDLQSFVAGDAAGAHEHFEEDVADSEGVGLGDEGGEGVVGDLVGSGKGGEDGGIVVWGEGGRRNKKEGPGLVWCCVSRVVIVRWLDKNVLRIDSSASWSS